MQRQGRHLMSTENTPIQNYQASPPPLPEEDAALQAIEALEVKSTDLDDEGAPATEPVVPVEPAPEMTPVPEPQPEPQPVVHVAPRPHTTNTPARQPIPEPTPVPEVAHAPAAPEPQKEPVAPPVVEVVEKPEPAEAPLPKRVEESENPGVPSKNDPLGLSAPAPVRTSFNPFAEQNRLANKKPATIFIVILVIIILGVGGYFGWQYYQSL